MNLLDQDELAVARKRAVPADRAADRFASVGEGSASVREHQALSLKHAPGSTIYRSSDLPTHVFVVRSGLVKVLAAQDDGSMALTGLAGKGQVIGFQKQPTHRYGEHAVALQPTTLDGVPSSDLTALANSAYDDFERLSQLWARSARRARELLDTFRTGTPEVRMARFCLFLAEAAETKAFFLPGRCDVSQVLELTLACSDIVLTNFYRKGWLIPVAGRRVVSDLYGLRTLMSAQEVKVNGATEVAHA